MSEYQFYEFQAVDRPLSSQEQAELRALSTRAEITAYRFTNVYHWGNFKGSPDQLMERYFDAHVYVTNWGTRHLMLRLPRSLFAPEHAAAYVVGQGATLRKKKDQVILSFLRDEEEPDSQLEGDGWLASLLALRTELLSGDLRGLYLGWLACAAAGELSPEDEEPPLPPGLRSPSTAQLALADFLLVPPTLREVAAQASPDREVRESRQELEAWVHTLPSAEKDALLLRALDGTSSLLGLELLQRFRAGRAHPASQAPAPRRTVGQLLRAAEALAEAQAQRERQRQAEARTRALEALAAREGAAWKQVEQLFATRRPADHDAGVRLLVDLREVARRRGTEAEFTRRLRLIREQNLRRHGLLARMNDAGLSGP